MNDTKNSPPSSQMSAKGAGQRSGLGFSIAVALLLIALVTGSAFGVQSLLRLVNPPITVAPLSPKAVELTQQLAERRAREATQLSGYGWVDKESGIARIPIAQAITLLAGQGLPVGIPPTATTTTATAITTTATTTTDTVESANTPAAAAVDLTNLNYQDHILLIFEAHCSKCHGEVEPEEGLTLTTYKGAMAGSLYGRVIAPGDPDNSYLVELVVNGKMPKRGDPLSQSEIDMVVAWIKAGAPESGDGTSAPIAASTPLTESTPVSESTPVTESTTITESAAITPTVVATHTVDLANVSFTNDVLPIFIAHCAECHGDDNPEEGLELTSYKKLMNGSLNGGVIKKGDPDDSYLVKMIVEGKMPKRAAPLVQSDIDTIIAWIKAGAVDDSGTAPAATSGVAATPVVTATVDATATITPENATATATVTEAATATTAATATQKAISVATPKATATRRAAATQTISKTAAISQPTATLTATLSITATEGTTNTEALSATVTNTQTVAATVDSKAVDLSAVDLENVSFTNDVLPIFTAHCFECHSNDNPEEGLELTSRKKVMAGSLNGGVVTPGDPDASYLVEMISTGKMPKRSDPLTQAEIDVIVAWIKAGALDN